MTAVEVLLPLRLETRFRSPTERDDGGTGWQLRLRVYPDDVSMPEPVPPPTREELQRLTEAVDALTATPQEDAGERREPVDERTAFAAFAASVGPARAFHLWRTRVTTDAARRRTVDRSDHHDAAAISVNAPVGLPPQLEVWLVHRDGRRELGATLDLNRAEIAADLDLEAIAAALDPSTPEPPPTEPAASRRTPTQEAWAAGTLPRTWWLDHRRAREVGLAVDIDLGPSEPALDVLVVVGIGDTRPAELVDTHAASGRLAVLAPGTPTNTMQGEPTTDLGTTEAFARLLDVDLGGQPATRAVLSALTGRVAARALPLLGGEVDQRGPSAVVVQALWPVLWGRALRDVTGGGAVEVDLARWAISHLAVQGPLPAVRIGDQPYGLLPTSSFRHWKADLDAPPTQYGDSFADLEWHILAWTVPWRDGAADAARTAAARVHGADTQRLLEVLGQHAPNRHWRIRPIAPLHLLQAARAMAGMAPLPASAWDRATAAAFTDRPYPHAPIGPAARSGRLAGPVEDVDEDAELWRQLLEVNPEDLYHGRWDDLGLVGRLVRQAVICSRAIVGEAFTRTVRNEPIELDAALPLDEAEYRYLVMQGSDDGVDELAGHNIGDVLYNRFGEVIDGIRALADRWGVDPDAVLAAVLAALDTATGRVDPWLTGVANRRLERLTARGVPRYLGAYGWVDAPAPFTADGDRRLAPGPTAAGLLHAPSDVQAMTAAVLRDAAVRHPDDDRWDMRIDSAKVRAAAALAERVRLGVHPFEAVGLEVERIAGDWNLVRELRKAFRLTDEAPQRRVCDGIAVLDAARTGALEKSLPKRLADEGTRLTARLAPLTDVLDTYADLLLADGVHAYVTGRADLAQAAMEAAAGLGAPPELRALRTARAATTVRVAAWVVLPPGTDPAAPEPVEPDPPAIPEDPVALPSPVTLADPAFVALAAAELGLDPTAVTEPDANDRVTRLAALLGGGEDEPLMPTLTGGAYEGLGTDDDGPRPSPDEELRRAVEGDLLDRLTRVRQLTQRTRAAVAAYDLERAGADDDLAALAARWAVDLAAVVPADADRTEPTPEDRRKALLEALDGRLGRVGSGTTSAAGARAAVREFVGRPWLPVLPTVPLRLLPTMRSAPDLDRSWLEVVAAARPRLAALEARQLAPDRAAWPARVAAPDGSIDAWHRDGPVLVVYDPASHLDEATEDTRVTIAALDAWDDAVPSRRHVTSAAFGFNAPRTRAPQAILLAVPPDPTQRLGSAGLLDVVLETRELVHARAARPRDRGGLPYATPAPTVHASGDASFLRGWTS